MRADLASSDHRGAGGSGDISGIRDIEKDTALAHHVLHLGKRLAGDTGSRICVREGLIVMFA